MDLEVLFIYRLKNIHFQDVVIMANFHNAFGSICLRLEKFDLDGHNLGTANAGDYQSPALLFGVKIP
ncbi:uncharacterized protein Dvar_31980 [Desulfosarcina variabilis str. Montpellier]|uniref:hypothetical protein n=1 Tax=Desulfosarcina variabilis TaxID=2300 RepID=UPI003AFA87E8